MHSEMVLPFYHFIPLHKTDGYRSQEWEILARELKEWQRAGFLSRKLLSLARGRRNAYFLTSTGSNLDSRRKVIISSNSSYSFPFNFILRRILGLFFPSTALYTSAQFVSRSSILYYLLFQCPELQVLSPSMYSPCAENMNLICLYRLLLQPWSY